MLIVEDKLVSLDVIEAQFLCDLNACKGACCWEGDYGAPLEPAEMEVLNQIQEALAPYLTEEGKAVLAEKGNYEWFDEPKFHGTPLLPNGACAYMTYDPLGRAKCGIEQAHRDGKVDFYKPISCHLYPIRVKEVPEAGFTAINYDKWEICAGGCSLGEREQLPLYQFVKDAIVRKFGSEFYEALDAAAAYHKSQKD